MNTIIPEKLNELLKKVTVFENCAELEYNIPLNLKKGENKIVLKSFDARLIDVSLSASLTTAKVTAVKAQLSALDDVKSDRFLKIEKDLDAIDKKIAALESNENIILQKKAFLIQTGSAKTDITSMLSFYEFFEGETKQFAKDLADIKTKLSPLAKEKSKLETELKNLSATNSQRQVITVDSVSNSDVKDVLTLKFVTYGIGWSPVYDIDFASDSPDAKFCFKANINQTLKQDFNNIALKLSTQSPQFGLRVPVLNPQYVGRPTPAPMAKPKQFMRANVMAFSASADMEDMVFEDADDTVTVNETLAATEFELSGTYTIVSDEEKTVELNSENLKAELFYMSVNKIDKNTYLAAKINDFSQFDFINGASANIFLDGALTGTTNLFIKNRDEDNIILISRDPSVIVTRVINKSLTSKKLIGANQKTSNSFTLTINNKKSKEIELTLIDQIPVSENKSYIIEAENLSDGTLNSDTGIITWKLKLKPNTKKEVVVTYTQTAPNGNKINV